MRLLKKRLKSGERLHSSSALNSALGFLAGYVDAFGYMALFGLFTAHITGNLVLLGAVLVTPEHTFPLLKILVFPAFIAGVVLAKMITSRCRRNESNALLVLYLLEMILLIGFMLVGIFTGPIEDNMSGAAIFGGIVCAMAMGVHSACGRLLLPDLTPTGMMTGNVTQFIIEFLEFIQGERHKKTRSNYIKYLWPILAFGLGAMSGAFAYFYFGFHALLLPIALILLLGYAEARDSRQV